MFYYFQLTCFCSSDILVRASVLSCLRAWICSVSLFSSTTATKSKVRNHISVLLLFVVQCRINWGETYQGIPSSWPKMLGKTKNNQCLKSFSKCCLHTNVFEELLSLERRWYDTYCQHSPPEEEGEGHHSNQSGYDHSLPRTAEKGLPWLPLVWQERNDLMAHKTQPPLLRNAHRDDTEWWSQIQLVRHHRSKTKCLRSFSHCS